jgi:hypothetical protein
LAKKIVVSDAMPFLSQYGYSDYNYQNEYGNMGDQGGYANGGAQNGGAGDDSLAALDQQLQASMNDINFQMSQISPDGSSVRFSWRFICSVDRTSPVSLFQWQPSPQEDTLSSPRKPFGGQAMPGMAVGPKRPFGGQAMPGMGNPNPNPNPNSNPNSSSPPSLNNEPQSQTGGPMLPTSSSNGTSTKPFGGVSMFPGAPNSGPTFGRSSSNPAIGSNPMANSGSFGSNTAPAGQANLGSTNQGLLNNNPITSDPNGSMGTGPLDNTGTNSEGPTYHSLSSPPGSLPNNPSFRGSGMVSSNPPLRPTSSAPNLGVGFGTSSQPPSPGTSLSDSFIVPPVPNGPMIGSEPSGSFSSGSSAGGDVVTEADIKHLQELQSQIPAIAISSGELKAGSIYKLGGKKPFLEWQVRRCVVTTAGKMQYYDPKKVKNSIRGELVLKGSKIELINDGNPNFPRLKKLSEKIKGVHTAFFQLKPPNVQKVYFFAVPSNEREEWIRILHTSEKAEQIIKDQQVRI